MLTDIDVWSESIQWPTCPNDHADPAAWIKGRDAAVRAFIQALGEAKPDFDQPLDTLIKVGMLADVEGHGNGLSIEKIDVALRASVDPAAESYWVSVGEAEARLLPNLVFSFGQAGWAYGHQIRRVYEKGAEQ